MKQSLRSWLWRVPVDREVDEELAFHLEMRTRELVEKGMTPGDARRVAAARLGNLAQLRRTCIDEGKRRDRAMRFAQWLDELRDDLKFGLRQLAAAPGFSFVAVATLALGIGANSAIFALVDAALLRPLPLPAPDRLVAVWERTESGARDGASPLNIADWNERTHSFEKLAGYVPNVGGMVMAGADGNAETVPRQWVTTGVFDILGLKPVAGRLFSADDDRVRARVVVLSEAFWRSRFGASPSIIGQSIRLDGDPFTVVGVVPQEAQLIGRSSMWALRTFDRRPTFRALHTFAVVGRMKPGVTLASATSDLSSAADALAREFPATNKGRGVTVTGLHDAVIGSDLRLTSLLFLGVVAFVLVICCANVANLLMARATARAGELATRAALGAGRRRIVRQLLTESLLLSAIGGALGLAVGAAILGIAPSIVPEGVLPSSVTPSFDVRVVAFCMAATAAVGVLFGVVPAWQAGSFSLSGAISAEGRGATVRGGRLRSLVVAGEVATAVLLLFGAGLLLRTLIAVDRVDRGYRADSILTMMVDPLGSRYRTAASLMQFFGEIENEVKAVPGVGSVAWASTLPMGDSVFGDAVFDVVGQPAIDPAQRTTADYEVVSPSYFPTLDLPVLEGRPFDDHDTREGAPVCIVNEAFAHRYLSGRSPIGAQVAVRSPAAGPNRPPVVREVVGVARQIKRRPDERHALLQIYVPLAQDPIDDMYLVVRPSAGRAEALTGSVRSAIGRVDKEQLVSVRDILTLDSIQWDATGRHRFRAVLVVTFAVLALLLAMCGVFGTLAYSVQQRARELAVRRALGATPPDVLRLVVHSAIRVVAGGAVVGLALAAMLGRLIANVLYGVAPLDPLTLAMVLVVLMVTAAASIAPPAWRAMRIDPARVLRGA